MESTDKKIDYFLGLQESQVFDCKRALIKPAKIIETVCAFANTDGGIIALGMEDPKKAPKTERLIGISEGADNVSDILNAPLLKDVFQLEGGLGQFPGALPDHDDRLVTVVLLDVRVIRRHAAQVMNRAVLVNKLVHVTGEAVLGCVNSRHGQQPVEQIGEAEIQIGGVGRAQAAAEDKKFGLQ